MKRILFLMLLGMTLLRVQAFADGGIVEIVQSPDAFPTPSSSWFSGDFKVCNSEQRSFMVKYSYTSHSSCWANRYRVTLKLFWNGNLIATAGPATVSSTFFLNVFSNITVVPGVWTATGTLERLPCCCSWYTAETVSSPVMNVTNFCFVLPSCPPNITISGSYTTFLTQASSSIISAGSTVIPGGADVRLDANDNTNNGFIELNPDFEAKAGSVFVAQALDGCGSGIPAKPDDPVLPEAATDIWRAFPNPTTGSVTVQHPPDLQALYVYSIDGKLLLTSKAGTSGKTDLDIGALAPGMYFIRADGHNPIKVVKQ